jgi:hypothetical protein
MITKEERAILRLAGILWIYEESIKSSKPEEKSELYSNAELLFLYVA